MVIKLRFRFPEVFFGALLAVALFAMGAMFWSSPNSSAPAQSQANTQSSERNPSNKPEIAWWQDPVAVFTLGLVFIGLLQAVIFYRQMRLIRKSLDPAEKAAKAAALNAEAVMNAEGAHLYPVIKKSNLKDVFLGPLLHPTMPDDGQVPMPRAIYRLKNYRKTPAIIQHVAAGMTFYGSDQKYIVLATASEAHQPLGIVVAGEETEEIECEISSVFNHGDAKAVINRKGELVFHGHVIYRDFFNRTFRSSWQFRARPDRFHLYKIEETTQPNKDS